MWPAKSCQICCNGYWLKWFIGLRSAMSQRADTKSTWGGVQRELGEFLYPSVGHIFSFLPFKCTIFMKCVTELWITLYIIYHLYQYCHILFYILRVISYMQILSNILQPRLAPYADAYAAWISHNRSTNTHISQIHKHLGKNTIQWGSASAIYTFQESLIQLEGRSWKISQSLVSL